MFDDLIEAFRLSAVITLAPDHNSATMHLPTCNVWAVYLGRLHNGIPFMFDMVLN